MIKLKMGQHMLLHSKMQISGALLILFMLSSCGTPTPPLYRWGNYENIIYTGFKDPGSSDPVNDAEMIAADIEKTMAQGQVVPPGVRVHLGYLYYVQGRNDKAREMFEIERELFPESTVFVNGLINRMDAGQ